MKKYILIISKNAIDIFKEITIQAEKEPDFWRCYNLAQKYNCDFFCLTEV